MKVIYERYHINILAINLSCFSADQWSVKVFPYFLVVRFFYFQSICDPTGIRNGDISSFEIKPFGRNRADVQHWRMEHVIPEISESALIRNIKYQRKRKTSQSFPLHPFCFYWTTRAKKVCLPGSNSLQCLELVGEVHVWMNLNRW